MDRFDKLPETKVSKNKFSINKNASSPSPKPYRSPLANYRKAKDELEISIRYIKTGRTRISPQFPVLKTSPRPLNVIHKLSKPFGRTYIANSVLLRLSSTNIDNPDKTPKNKNENFEISRSITDCGIRLKASVAELPGMRPNLILVRYRCSLCL